MITLHLRVQHIMNCGVRRYSLACDLAEMVPEASDVPHTERAWHFRQSAPHLALLFSFVLSLQSAALTQQPANHTKIFNFYETVYITEALELSLPTSNFYDQAVLLQFTYVKEY